MALEHVHGHALTLESLREAVDAARSTILTIAERGSAGSESEVAGSGASGEAAQPATAAASSADAIAADAARRLAAKSRRSLRPVINATGIVVHTNLGRSSLAEAAVEAVAEVARGYSTLEYDVASGERGSRHVHVEGLICRLTGAEARWPSQQRGRGPARLAALARRKEAIVSRGQLVEIGGSFRIPDIMRESGAKMVEIGPPTRRTCATTRALSRPGPASS